MDKKTFLSSKELAGDVEAFLLEYQKAWKAGTADLAKIMKDGGSLLPDGSSVEFTEELLEKLNAVVGRAAKMLGSKAGHETTIFKHTPPAHLN